MSPPRPDRRDRRRETSVGLGSLIFVVLAVTIWSCSKDKSTSADSGDTVPPAAVTDLVCSDSIGDGTITLSWTAPGDDSTIGQAAQYDLRYSYTPISEANWDSARALLIVSVPRAAGSTDSVTIPNLSWWTVYHFALRAKDDSSNWSTISNVVAVTPLPDSNLRLLIRTRDGAYISDLYRNVRAFAEADGEIEVSANRIFVVGDSASIREYDLQGVAIDTIPIPDTVRVDGFVALPGDRFALLSNTEDMIHVIDRDGQILGMASMRDSADDREQNVKGVVVGSLLIVSEDGDRRLVRLNLDSYTVRPYKNLQDLPGELGDIDRHESRYYICAGRYVFTFTEGGQPAIAGRLDGGTLTGIAVAGGHCFVTTGAGGAVYSLNNATGQAQVFISGLADPRDIELWRP